MVVLDAGAHPDTLWVRGSNRAHLSYVHDARSGTIIAMSAIDNLVPFIPGEEDKIETETRKILGHVEDGRIAETIGRISPMENVQQSLEAERRLAAVHSELPRGHSTHPGRFLGGSPLLGNPCSCLPA